MQRTQVEMLYLFEKECAEGGQQLSTRPAGQPSGFAVDVEHIGRHLPANDHDDARDISVQKTVYPSKNKVGN